jgi:hypothetical protein
MRLYFFLAKSVNLRVRNVICVNIYFQRHSKSHKTVMGYNMTQNVISLKEKFAKNTPISIRIFVCAYVYVL